VVHTNHIRLAMPDEMSCAAPAASIWTPLVPGIGHCGGGPGPNTFDAQAALDQWVEHGRAPETIVASHVAKGVTVRTRPLCPYPQIAKWKVSGSIDDAANFACVDATRLPQ